MWLPLTTHIKNSETGDWLDWLVASKIGVLFNSNFHRDMVIKQQFQPSVGRNHQGWRAKDKKWTRMELELQPKTGWWFGTMEFYDFQHILGISSSQLTFTPSFFRGVGLNHQPEKQNWVVEHPVRLEFIQISWSVPMGFLLDCMFAVGTHIFHHQVASF